jgi:hypothetical protein
MSHFRLFRADLSSIDRPEHVPFRFPVNYIFQWGDLQSVSLAVGMSLFFALAIAES